MTGGTHAKVTGAMIVPTSGRIDKSSGIQLLDQLGESKFRIISSNLAPALIIDNLLECSAGISASMWRVSYPCCDTGETLVLVDQQLQLTCKLFLLRGVRQNGLAGTVCQGLTLQGTQCGHVLNHQKTELVTCLVEQVILDFDL